MDPYIEVNPRWEGFHAWFVRKLAEHTLPTAQQLGCWIDVERMVYQQDPNGEAVLIGEPDETVAMDASSAPWRKSAAQATAAVAQPRAVHEVVLDPASLERIKQDYLKHAWITLEPLGLPMAVMGGLALATWKHVRTTCDVDLLVGVVWMRSSKLVNLDPFTGLEPLAKTRLPAGRGADRYR
jgi:hypothetical protein